jgi:hypothetical protein
VVFASGFLTPDDDQDGAAFGLFAALPSGDVVEFPLYVGSTSALVSGVDRLVVGNFPNPFNPTTTIWYSLPTSSHVTLEIYNVLGQRVTLLVDREQGAGAHTAMWDASSAPSGVYFYRLSTSDLTETRKIMLLK